MARIYSGTCKEINPDFNAPTSWALYLWRYVCFLGFLNLLKGKIFSSLLNTVWLPALCAGLRYGWMLFTWITLDRRENLMCMHFIYWRKSPRPENRTYIKIFNYSQFFSCLSIVIMFNAYNIISKIFRRTTESITLHQYLEWF